MRSLVTSKSVSCRRLIWPTLYCATSNNMKLIHWPLMGGLLHLVQRWGD